MKTLSRFLATSLLLSSALPAWAQSSSISAPGNLTGFGLSQKIVISYTKPIGAGCNFSGFQYSTDDGATFALVSRTVTPAIFETTSSNNMPLVNGTAYTVKLKAISSNCTPEVSDAITVTPKSAAAVNTVAFGSNGDGQLGTGTNGVTALPTAVVTDTGGLAGKVVTQVSGGTNHSCATADGQAFCWGNGNSGRLGTGNTNSTGTPTAVDGTLLTNKFVTQISVGAIHTCAIADGELYCWGNNFDGQLGNNSKTTSLVPVKVEGALADKTILSVAAGFDHTCAIAAELKSTPDGEAYLGKAYCWGKGDFGQLGHGEITTQGIGISKLVPTAVRETTDNGAVPPQTPDLAPLISLVQIGAGASHSCALDTAGLVYCWGQNTTGQLGTGNTVNTSPAKFDRYAYQVSRVSGQSSLFEKTVKQISLGARHSCAVATNGSAHCWGNNQNGELGNTPGNNTPNTASQPVEVIRLTNFGGTIGLATSSLAGKIVTQISAGGNTTVGHTCAVASDGSAHCWGRRDSGQGGSDAIGSNTLFHIRAVAVNTESGAIGGKKVTQIEAGVGHTLAITETSAPAAPTNLTITNGTTSVSVAFTAGGNGGSAITNYKYSTDNGVTYTALSPADTTTPVTIPGLTLNTMYQIKLRAVNAVGDGAESAASAVTTLNTANGVCGTASGTTATATAPTGTAACSSGVLATVGVIGNSNGKWNWTCDGIGGGSNTALLACSAPYASQTIDKTSADPNPARVGDSVSLFASGGESANDVTFSTTSTNCSVILNAANVTAPGTCTVKANQLGTGDNGTSRYLAAAEVSFDISVLYNEDNVPSADGGAPGDGNGDGDQDNTQPNVDSVATGSSVVTVESVGSTTALMSLTSVPVPTDLPAGTNAAATGVAFTITGVSPLAGQVINLYFPLADKVVGLMKKNLVTGLYDTLATTITTEGNKTKVSFTIVDNGPYDSEAMPGIISDPLIPLIGGSGGKGTHDDGFLGLGALNPLMLVLLGLLGFRRRFV